MNNAKVVQQVKKLLSLADDDGAFDGEISAAVAHAEKLMNEHHLSRADVEATEIADVAHEDTMGQATAAMHGKTLATWEGWVARAICDLVGSVQCYRNIGGLIRTEGAFQKQTHYAAITFYGVEEDCRLAVELMEEWIGVIATLACGKYEGSPFRGDGGMYCSGFAEVLCDKARAVKKNRFKISTSSTNALVSVEGGTLGALLAKKKDAGTTWLSENTDIRLGSRQRRQGNQSGSYDARNAGRSDGQRADFQAKRSRRLTA